MRTVSPVMNVEILFEGTSPEFVIDITMDAYHEAKRGRSGDGERREGHLLELIDPQMRFSHPDG